MLQHPCWAPGLNAAVGAPPTAADNNDRTCARRASQPRDGRRRCKYHIAAPLAVEKRRLCCRGNRHMCRELRVRSCQILMQATARDRLSPSARTRACTIASVRDDISQKGTRKTPTWVVDGQTRVQRSEQENAGVPVALTCAQGTCGTCPRRLTSRTDDWLTTQVHSTERGSLRRGPFPSALELQQL